MNRAKHGRSLPQRGRAARTTKSKDGNARHRQTPPPHRGPARLAEAQPSPPKAVMDPAGAQIRMTEFPDNGRFFEVRFESIGGLGAHAAGQILTTAAVLRLGLNGAHFSSYGSEKKGSLVRSYVRLGPHDKPIRTSAPAEAPDAIVVFHAALLRNPITLAGLRADGTFVYNAPPGHVPAELERLPKRAWAVRVDALQIAVEEKSRPNAVMLGALTAIYPFLSPGVVLEVFSEEFSKRHPEAMAANKRAFERGAKEYEIVSMGGTANGNLQTVRPGPVWGYETAPIGGVLPAPGNSIWNDLTASRAGWIPVFDPERCIHCALCEMVCPDLCLAWNAESGAASPAMRLTGIDYRYCKGCLRCVETCPTGALTREVEQPGMAERLRVKLFPGVVP